MSPVSQKHFGPRKVQYQVLLCPWKHFGPRKVQYQVLLCPYRTTRLHKKSIASYLRLGGVGPRLRLPRAVLQGLHLPHQRCAIILTGAQKSGMRMSTPPWRFFSRHPQRIIHRTHAKRFWPEKFGSLCFEFNVEGTLAEVRSPAWTSASVVL